jgi:dynactin complex subunit
LIDHFKRSSGAGQNIRTQTSGAPKPQYGNGLMTNILQETASKTSKTTLQYVKDVLNLDDQGSVENIYLMSIIAINFLLVQVTLYAKKKIKDKYSPNTQHNSLIEFVFIVISVFVGFFISFGLVGFNHAIVYAISYSMVSSFGLFDKKEHPVKDIHIDIEIYAWIVASIVCLLYHSDTPMII